MKICARKRAVGNYTSYVTHTIPKRDNANIMQILHTKYHILLYQFQFLKKKGGNLMRLLAAKILITSQSIVLSNANANLISIRKRNLALNCNSIPSNSNDYHAMAQIYLAQSNESNAFSFTLTTN